MSNRWRLVLLALVGLAATGLFVALDSQPAATQPANEQPASERPDGQDWEYVEWKQDKFPWTGSVPKGPCEVGGQLYDADFDRQGCVYTVVHFNPWYINKPGSVENKRTYYSHCTDIGGPADERPGDSILFTGSNGTCTDGDDPHASANRHGDEDLLQEHPHLRTAGVQPNLGLGHALDEIRSLGHHHNAASNYATHNHEHTWFGGTKHNLSSRTGHNHKDQHRTVYYWSYWERAAEPPETTFAPVVSIGVPDDSAHVGSRFRVSFSRVAGSDAGCTASARGLYALASYDHTARVYRVTQDADVSLVGKPSALSGKCRYTATFPLSPFRPSSSRLERQRVIDDTLDADAPQVSAEYHVPAVASATFQSRVSIRKPTGFASASFVVSFAPSRGTGCSAPQMQTFSGSTSGATRNGPELIDRADGSIVSCEYEVTFPDEVDGLTLKSAAMEMATINASRRLASATYVDTNSQFVPDITIEVEDGKFPDHTFRVNFSGSSGCSNDTSASYHQGTNEYSRYSSQIPWLYTHTPDNPPKQCRYEVAFPETVSKDGVTLELKTPPNGLRFVRSSSPSATATYKPQACDSPNNMNYLSFGVGSGEVRRGNRTHHSWQWGRLSARYNLFEFADTGDLWHATWEFPPANCHAGDSVVKYEVDVSSDGDITRLFENVTRYSGNDHKSKAEYNLDLWPSGSAQRFYTAIPRWDFLSEYNFDAKSYWPLVTSVVTDQPHVHRQWFQITACQRRKKSGFGLTQRERYTKRCNTDNRLHIKTPWVCPTTDANPLVSVRRSHTSIPDDVADRYDPDQPATVQHLYDWCYGRFPPVVFIEVPDGYREGQANAAEIEVEFTKKRPQPSPNVSCDTGTETRKFATYTPAANRDDPATLITGDRLLDGACVYTVDYENPAADGDLELDPEVAHDLEVTADDPATKATYTQAKFQRAAATTHAVVPSPTQVA